MKFLYFFILMISQLIAYSQDQIITKDKDTYLVRVVQEEKKSVTFYLLSDTSRTIQSLDKKNIKNIKYERPSIQNNTIVITDDLSDARDLFSNVVSYFINSGFEIKTFDKDLLTASALFNTNFRISVDVENHNAHFSCYISEEEDNTRPSQSKSNVIKFAPSENKDSKDEKYPGEDRDNAGGRAFKEMDKICRLYLKENKGTLIYETE